MNKIYISKWNFSLRAWVACSELVTRKAKCKQLVVLGSAALLAPLAFAQGTCASYTNDVINTAYTCVPVAVDNTTFSANGNLIYGPTGGSGNQQKNMYATLADVVVGSTSARKPYTNAGTAIATSGWDTPGGLTNNTISANNVSLYLDGSGAGTNAYAGAGAGYGGKIWLNNFTLDVANANNGDLNGVLGKV